MFGTNIIVSQKLDETGELKFVELFYTIQGEGPYSGMPSVFLRLAGCNLRCRWCDTDFETGARVETAEAIALEIKETAKGVTDLVVITGGEPMLQNIVPLIQILNRRGMRCQIETAGTIWVPGLEALPVTLVCSPKTGKVHKQMFERCQNYKYVVGHDDAIVDGRVFTQTQPTSKPVLLAEGKAGSTIWIQPRDDHDEVANEKNVEFARDLCLQHGYRLCLQLHKLVGVA
jgi:organic radical activating enzyme